jgi:hypothetical protein
MAIEFSASDTRQVFTCASDTAFADDPVTRYSTEGYLFKLFGGPIDWRSTKHRAVTTSSTEAELLALSHTAKEVLWWKRLFKAVQLDPGHEITIQCDNRQTIRPVTAEFRRLTTKLKHIDVQHHWLRQEVSVIPTGRPAPSAGLLAYQAPAIPRIV